LRSPSREGREAVNEALGTPFSNGASQAFEVDQQHQTGDQQLAGADLSKSEETSAEGAVAEQVHTLAGHDEGALAESDMEAGAPDSEVSGHQSNVVNPSNIIVHGVGTPEDILDMLQDIEDTCKKQSSQGHTRKFDSVDEFAALVKRVKTKEAEVVLRKLFLCRVLCREDCNAMKEIWIRDKKNPLAERSPLKSYAVVHVHHHAQVAQLRDFKPTHLDAVDAINARHLATAGSFPQGDNPFFDTYIEPSGLDTLKVFPPGQWQCKCKQRNYWNKAQCRGWDR
jgi:hypothetical protein